MAIDLSGSIPCGTAARWWCLSTFAFSAGAPISKGIVVAITRAADDAYGARLVTFVAIYSAVGLRDEQANKRLAEAMRSNPMPVLKRLRREPHDREASCWLHDEGWCLGIDEKAQAAAAKGQAIAI